MCLEQLVEREPAWSRNREGGRVFGEDGPAAAVYIYTMNAVEEEGRTLGAITGRATELQNRVSCYERYPINAGAGKNKLTSLVAWDMRCCSFRSV